VFLDGNELRPIDGDFGKLKRNSVGEGVVSEEVVCDSSDGIGCNIGESGSLRSDS
jgi:hypothetical protein